MQNQFKSSMPTIIARLALGLLFIFSFTERIMASDDFCEKVEKVATEMFDENSDCDYSLGQMNTCISENTNNYFHINYFYGKLNNGHRFTIMYDVNHMPFGILLSNNKLLRLYGYIYSKNYKDYFYSKERPNDYNFLIEFESCKVKNIMLKSY